MEVSSLMGEYSRYREKELREMEKYYYAKNDCGKKVHCCPKRCCCEDIYCEKKHHKHDDKKHDQKKDRANLTDFEFYTLPRNVNRPDRLELPRFRQEAVASLTLDKVKKGDVVWLNGVFGLDNDDPDDVATVIMRIYKGNPPVFIPGTEIYRAVIEIDDGGNDDQVVEPLAHVDTIHRDEKNVTYTVTLEVDEDPVFLNGPVTFTAAVISK